MRHSLNQFSSILNPKPQINLYFANTFFALTLASYYVAAHHAPKGLHWPSHLKLYEFQKDVIEEKPLLDELSLLLLLRNPPHFSIHQSLDFAVSKQGIFSVVEPTVVLEKVLENILITEDNLGNNYRVQDTINENVHVALSRRESLHFQSNPALFENLNPLKIAAQGDVEKLMVNFSPLPPPSELPPLAAPIIDSLKTVYQGTLGLDDPLNPMLGYKISIIKNIVFRELADKKTMVSEKLPPLSSPVLEEVTSLVHSPILEESPSLIHSPALDEVQYLVSSILEEKPSVISSLIEEAPSLVVSSVIEEAPSLVVSSVIEEKPSLVVSSVLEETPAGVVSPESSQVATKNASSATAPALDSWDRYMVRVSSKSHLVRYWLMLLTSRSCVDPDEILLRQAFIETVIEYQHHIGVSWEPSEEEDSPELKGLRENFFYSYIKKVDWAATSYKRLYLNEELEDLHQVNEDAYLHAYHMPLNLRVKAYCDEDFCASS